jgi:3D (Asp-Asp-Asp) domain-containing protein
MKKNITIIILIIIIAIISLVFFIREGVNLSKINRLRESMLEKEADHEIECVELVLTIDGIFKHYQKFLGDYREAAYEKINPDLIGENLQIRYREFEVTAYTSNECGTITSTGIDLQSRYAKYLNIAAVDPSVVPYGSTLLIKFADGEIKPYLAMDCGYEIKGNDIDIYMTDTGKAIEFGRQKLKVMVIN